MNKKFFPFVLILLIAISCGAILISCSQGPSSPDSIKLLNHNMTVQKFGASPSSVAVVSGSAQNVSNSVIAKATVVVTFYDDKGNVIDTASASTTNFRAGEFWNFSTQSSGPDSWKIVDYKIKIQI